jgi:hypothetical protein
MAKSRKECIQHGKQFIQILEQMGWQISPKKSVLTPSQTVQFLGVEINSATMMFKVPAEKLRKLKHDLRSILKKETVSPRELSGIAGKINAISVAVTPVAAHIRKIHHFQHQMIRQSHWDHQDSLHPEVREEIQWWLDHLDDWNGKAIIPKPVEKIIQTDASNLGWGAVLGQHIARGFWSEEEKSWHNNMRELMAVFKGLQSFENQIIGKSIQVQIDNTVAVSYVNRMGGKIQQLNNLATTIWNWCLDRKISLQGDYLPGELNTIADALSRINDKNDWKLHPSLFKMLDNIWGPHEVDMFASTLNHQVPRFFAWNHQPGAEAIDAFCQDWTAFSGYANPPFCLITRVLSQLQRQRATITLITPIWVTTPWFPLLLEMCIDYPIILPDWRDLFLPGCQGNQTPMNNPAWRAAAWRVSGNTSLITNFHKQHRNWFYNLGKIIQPHVTTRIGKFGQNGVNPRRSTPQNRYLTTLQTFLQTNMNKERSLASLPVIDRQSSQLSN